MAFFLSLSLSFVSFRQKCAPNRDSREHVKVKCVTASEREWKRKRCWKTHARWLNNLKSKGTFIVIWKLYSAHEFVVVLSGHGKWKNISCTPCQIQQFTWSFTIFLSAARNAMKTIFFMNWIAFSTLWNCWERKSILISEYYRSILRMSKSHWLLCIPYLKW